MRTQKRTVFNEYEIPKEDLRKIFENCISVYNIKSMKIVIVLILQIGRYFSVYSYNVKFSRSFGCQIDKCQTLQRRYCVWGFSNRFLV